MESEIHEGFANKQDCIAVFFDITRAYDTAWRQGILKTLHKWDQQYKSIKYMTTVSQRY